jgi:hypothetical protein
MLITFFNKTTKNIFNTKHVKIKSNALKNPYDEGGRNPPNYKPPLTIIDKKEYIFLKD